MVLTRLDLRNQKKRQKQSGVLFGVLLLWFISGFVARGASFTASLDRDAIRLGEAATLSLTFSEAGQQPTPTVPPIPNLQINYVGPSSQYTIVNGQASSSVTHVFNLMPRQIGVYQIPAITVRVGPTQLTTQTLKLTVLKPDAPNPQSPNAAQIAFLKLTLPKTNMFVGEVMVGKIEVFISERVQGMDRFNFSQMQADAFTLGKMVERPRFAVQANGGNYRVVPLEFSVKALKSGSFPLGPLTASAVVTLPLQGRSRDPFAEFFNRGQQQEVNLASEAITIRCEPLPSTNVPPMFSGAVGSFAFSAAAGPTNVGVGDPITLKVQVSGRGSLDSVSLPDQGWKNFKIYPPTSKVESADPLGIEGSKSFEQVMIPQSSETTELPPFAFSFFDPELKSYRTLQSSAVKLTIHPSSSGPSIAAVPGGNVESNAPPQVDIVPIKTDLGTVVSSSPPLLQQPWFLAVQGIPCAAFVTLLIRRKRAESLARNPRLRRRRKVDEATRNGLRELHELARLQKPEEFFALLFHLLQEQLGARLDLPAFGITEQVIEEHLMDLSETTRQILRELFQACDQARYSPTHTSQEMEATLPRFEQVVRDLWPAKG